MTTETPDDLDDGQWPDPNEMHRSFLASYEGEYRTTGNPLYVWEAISLCHHEALMHAPKTRAGLAEFWAAPQLQLPPWVIRYLADVASEFYFLEQGLDRRTYPPDIPDGNADDEAEVRHRWRMNPTLDFNQALSRVPDALGLVRQGWNAFRDRAARRAREIDLDVLTQHQLAGLTARQARERLMDELGLQDERSLRRRLSQARRETQAWREGGSNVLPKSDPDEPELGSNSPPKLDPDKT